LLASFCHTHKNILGKYLFFFTHQAAEQASSSQTSNPMKCQTLTTHALLEVAASRHLRPFNRKSTDKANDGYKDLTLSCVHISMTRDLCDLLVHSFQQLTALQTFTTFLCCSASLNFRNSQIRGDFPGNHLHFFFFFFFL